MYHCEVKVRRGREKEGASDGQKESDEGMKREVKRQH
jgi:hypothetical protein